MHHFSNWILTIYQMKGRNYDALRYVIFSTCYFTFSMTTYFHKTISIYILPLEKELKHQGHKRKHAENNSLKF
jgi:hypothetical protein